MFANSECTHFLSLLSTMHITGMKPMSLWKSELWMASLSWAAAWDSSVSRFPAQTRDCYDDMRSPRITTSPSFSHLLRTLPGPEEAEAGSLSPPLGWHLLRAPRTHVHVTRGTKPQPLLNCPRPYCDMSPRKCGIIREDVTNNIAVNSKYLKERIKIVFSFGNLLVLQLCEY